MIRLFLDTLRLCSWEAEREEMKMKEPTTNLISFSAMQIYKSISRATHILIALLINALIHSSAYIRIIRKSSRGCLYAENGIFANSMTTTNSPNTSQLASIFNGLAAQKWFVFYLAFLFLKEAWCWEPSSIAIRLTDAHTFKLNLVQLVVCVPN